MDAEATALSKTHPTGAASPEVERWKDSSSPVAPFFSKLLLPLQPSSQPTHPAVQAGSTIRMAVAGGMAQLDELSLNPM